MKTDSSRVDLKYLLGILICLFLFYPKLFLGQSGLLVADHLWQHYPWHETLWKSVREFKLPFWTPLIHCGFPIAAESQIGIFYLPNLVINFLLPLNWAYSYTTVLHFILSGFATYFYARQIGLKPQGSFISAFLFLFGAAHGGAYYNITSLKTIAWFPLGLWLFESVYQRDKWHYFIYLSFVFAMTLMAGYMQMGALCLFVFLVYVLLRVVFFPEQGRNNFPYGFKICLGVMISLLMTVVIALPQLVLTYPLALLSNRSGVVEEYAYVGSMFPGAISTFFFPHWNNVFRGNNLYVGIFSLFLLIAAFYRQRDVLHKSAKLWLCIGIFALLMALGQWSPFYILFVKLTQFYAFRTPAKFLLFICFSFSLLGGIGFQNIWECTKNKKPSMLPSAVAKQFMFISFIFIGAAGCLLIVFTIAQPWVMKMGDWIINLFFYGKAGHPHSLEMYQDKFVRYVQQILSYFTLGPWTIWNMVMIITGLFFSIWLIKIKRWSRTWLIAGCLFLSLDLYCFSFITFKGGFNEYQKFEIESPVIKHLLKQHEKGLVSRVYGFNYNWKLLPVLPSLNMHYGYADIGAYSPFVLKRYYDTIGLLGNVDDSNFSKWPEPDFVSKHLNLLKLTGVSHVLSRYPLSHKDLTMLMEDSGDNLFLYRFDLVDMKAYFVHEIDIAEDWEAVKQVIMNPNFNPFKTLVVEKSEAPKHDALIVEHKILENEVLPRITLETAESDLERWRISTNRPGYFVVANSYYPGWRATVNGKPVKIIKAYGLFQAVPIVKSGESLIEFQFSPFRK